MASPGYPTSYGNGHSAPVPLLLLETRPPDGGAFNRADYYRTAGKLLGEPFYQRRLLVDVDTEQTWEKKGRSRSKATQFHDSPELRHALEEAMTRRGVRAVILDEAQHLLKVGRGSSGGKLLDQLDWLKSMTNVTGVLHILIGTYELLNFRNLSGQASRRGLDLHFPRLQSQRQLPKKSRPTKNQHPRKDRLARRPKKLPPQPRKLPLMPIARSESPPVPKSPQKNQHPPRKNLPDGSDSASYSEIRSAKIKRGD